MKSVLAHIIILLSCNSTFGQHIYSATKPAYKLNNFTYQFYLLEDSSCFLKGYYPGNNVYFLYKGQLSKVNDSLFTFNYQPVVKFTCNKGHRTNDSLRFYTRQVDTLIPSLTYRIKTGKNSWKNIDLTIGKTTAFIKGISTQNISVDTKFTDPLTRKNILSTFNMLSDPDLTYYGSNTEFSSLTISVIRNRLTIYPDLKHIHDVDIFELVQ